MRPVPGPAGAVQVVVPDHDRPTCRRHRPPVGALVVPGRARQRDKNRGYTGQSQLRDRVGAGPLQRDICGTVERHHVLFVLHPLISEALVGERDVFDLGPIAAPDHVADGNIAAAGPIWPVRGWPG